MILEYDDMNIVTVTTPDNTGINFSNGIYFFPLN